MIVAEPGNPAPLHVEFIDKNGGGPGVRLKKRQQKKARASIAGLLITTEATPMPAIPPGVDY